MICLWYDGKYYDAWFNTTNDTYFMEVSMINLGLDPALCEWVDYSSNPNGHNPKQVNDTDKSFNWIIDTIVPEAVVTNPNDIPTIQKQYYGNKVFQMLNRILSKQNEILDGVFLTGEEPMEIPSQYIAPTVVENKIVMNPMQTLTPQEEVFTKGERKKLYSGETALPPKLDTLKKIAVYLLSKSTKWNGEFLDKLNKLKAS